MMNFISLTPPTVLALIYALEAVRSIFFWRLNLQNLQWVCHMAASMCAKIENRIGNSDRLLEDIVSPLESLVSNLKASNNEPQSRSNSASESSGCARL